ncbi:hypothetical protein ACFFX0_21210 [Citricoccus parietis]|uniref:Uncharacterized protein n=1 Tax=Citricoccus parietis TaxID=592307 RepID=A0ABV5G3S3_9MICC
MPGPCSDLHLSGGRRDPMDTEDPFRRAGDDRKGHGTSSNVRLTETSAAPMPPSCRQDAGL